MRKRSPWRKNVSRIRPPHFGSKLNGRKAYRFRRNVKHAVFVLLLIGIGLFVWESRQAPEPVSEVSLNFRLCAEQDWGQPCVIDGDTLAIGQRRVRLTGYDAPEMDGPCNNERHKAAVARDRLASWLGQGSFQWTGGEDPAYDRYGRELREARRGEELLAEVMIGEGLAEGSGWGAKAIEWC